ncbi:DUF938 domain-containing protein [Saccharospirillum sp.]|uniref:DUF938 domain-containing protein n=1 Tax=Saccharospirillum sp. TaxID=2033801 RepID=UPI00349FFE40
MANELPFSQACENNKSPILEELREVFGSPARVLEIGTGTGQHAVYFAQSMPHLQWQPSEHPDAIHHSQQRLEQAALPNILPIVALDVARESWPLSAFDGAFSANTAHIMAWTEVGQMFQGVGDRLTANGAFCLYGPFNKEGQFTSESNRQFDRHLRSRAPQMGIRDLAEVTELAKASGLFLENDIAMPANNRLLIFRLSDTG